MEFDSNKPIYLQICDSIFDRILSGDLQPGGRIPSVRELGADIGVNPNTVMRSYEKLTDAGIIFKEEFGRMGSLSEAVMYAPGQMPERVSEFWTGFRNLPQVLQRQGLNEEHTNWFLKSVNWQN